MRIAQVSPLFESVPPRLYGGTERIVSYLTEELVAMGHDVTLYASGDSHTRARLVPGCARSLRLNPSIKDQIAPHLVMLEKLSEEIQGECFDVVHFHTDPLHFPFLPRWPGVRHLTTLHGRLDLDETAELHGVYRPPVVSISDAQRRPLPSADWQGTVYHGLPARLFSYESRPGRYLAFLGRVSPEKGLDRAIAIARAAGMPLRVAAKVDPADEQYFREVVAPLLNDPLVEFIGEISDAEKPAFLGNAYALVFPIQWPEPFGIVMIESLACGTPVVAFEHGSVSEVIEDGVTGFIVDDTDEFVAALGKITTLDRAACRRAFELRFSARRMAEDYFNLYEKLFAGDRPVATVCQLTASA